MKRSFKQQTGMEPVEYAVMAALIVAALVAAIAALAMTFQNRYNALNQEGDTPPAVIQPAE